MDNLGRIASIGMLYFPEMQSTTNWTKPKRGRALIEHLYVGAVHSRRTAFEAIGAGRVAVAAVAFE